MFEKPIRRVPKPKGAGAGAAPKVPPAPKVPKPVAAAGAGALPNIGADVVPVIPKPPNIG